MKRRLFFLLSFILIIFVNVCYATPSTQIWNPSTDIQQFKTVHLGIDNYFTLAKPANGGYAFPTDIGITYGLFKNFEIGFDIFLPQSSPFMFNVKYAIPEGKNYPSVAFGGFGFGTEKNVTDQNVLYLLAAKTLPKIGRITIGYFRGNRSVLVNPAGNEDNNGFVFTWDKNLSDKLWACIDYSSTKSALGALFVGASWKFSDSTSVIFSYGRFNNGAKPVLTTQLDINLN